MRKLLIGVEEPLLAEGSQERLAVGTEVELILWVTFPESGGLAIAWPLFLVPAALTKHHVYDACFEGLVEVVGGLRSYSRKGSRLQEDLPNRAGVQAFDRGIHQASYRLMLVRPCSH